MTHVEGGYPTPDEFPSYDAVDSRIVIDPKGSFNESEADFEAEPTGEGDG